MALAFDFRGKLSLLVPEECKGNLFSSKCFPTAVKIAKFGLRNMGHCDLLLV